MGLQGWDASVEWGDAVLRSRLTDFAGMALVIYSLASTEFTCITTTDFTLPSLRLDPPDRRVKLIVEIPIPTEHVRSKSNALPAYLHSSDPPAGLFRTTETALCKLLHRDVLHCLQIQFSRPQQWNVLHFQKTVCGRYPQIGQAGLL